MALNTQNAGGLVAGAVGKGRTFLVRFLKATHVHSLDRTSRIGEEVEVSDRDYAFLKPYGYCEDVTEATPTPESDVEETTEEVTADEDTVEASETDTVNELVEEFVEDVTEAVAEQVKVTGKRKNRS